MFAAPSKALKTEATRLVFCLLLSVGVPAPAVAQAKGSAPVRLDTATVTGSDGHYSNIDIKAQSGPTGENPSGRGTFLVFGFIQVDGPVTCLRVTGKTAIFNVQDQASGSGVVAVSVTDNGGGGQDLMTTLGGVGSSRAPTDCSPFVGLTDTLTNGRATVVDAAPLPTSKQQCKSGGWAQYGFANQGQCIKFVNHP